MYPLVSHLLQVAWKCNLRNCQFVLGKLIFIQVNNVSYISFNIKLSASSNTWDSTPYLFNPPSPQSNPYLQPHLTAVFLWDFSYAIVSFVAPILVEKLMSSCIYPSLAQRKSVLLLLASHCCLTTQVLISHLLPSTLS